MRSIIVSFLLASLALGGLAACSTDASHIPPLHQLPGAAIGSVIENSRYQARRDKVKAMIQPHYDLLMTDVSRGGGTTFDITCRAANVSPPKCQELLSQIAQDSHIYGVGTLEERIEKLTIAFMVYGD